MAKHDLSKTANTRLIAVITLLVIMSFNLQVKAVCCHRVGFYSKRARIKLVVFARDARIRLRAPNFSRQRDIRFPNSNGLNLFSPRVFNLH